MNSITTHTYTINRKVRSITRSTVRERTVRRVRLHSKQENSIVERFNKVINRHLRALSYDNLSLTDYS